MHAVSVVIPVYNTSKYLSRCLESVLAQTLASTEVIIVNDGSTDDSETICKDFINKNGLNWKLYTKKNGGLSSARHFGWEHSSGECIVFVDSDDDLHPDYCKHMYEAIKSTDSQIAICGYNIQTEKNEDQYLPEFDATVIENVKETYCKRLIFSTDRGGRIPGFLWMRMMKRDLISEEYFIDENKVFAEDQIFDLAYSQVVNRIVIVKEALYNYYINPGSLTLKYRPDMLEMNMNLCNFHINFLKSNNLLDPESRSNIESTKIEGFISAITNSIRFGDYFKTKQLVKKLRNYSEYREPFEYLLSEANLRFSHRVWWLLIRMRLEILPYVYYKIRYR